MPRNIEIKARVDSIDTLRVNAQALADGPLQVLDQDDTFFAARHGRLKLRVQPDGLAELIHYERPDDSAARASDYVRVATPDADALREALARGLGLIGRVRKRRWLLKVGQTRIHLDRVEGLGDFIELEVVLREGQSDAEGIALAEALMHALGLARAPRIAGAYLDLLRADGVSSTTAAATGLRGPSGRSA